MSKVQLRAASDISSSLLAKLGKQTRLHGRTHEDRIRTRMQSGGTLRERSQRRTNQ